MIHAGADQHLWAQTYEGAASDILDVQARVARDVAAGLRAELSQDERARLTTLRTVHPQAYSLYLKGRYNARILTEEGQRKAIRYFQDSIRFDPHDASAYYYASAYAGIAECFIELAYFFGMEPKSAFAEAEVAAVKAVTLDATLAEGHAALGLLRLLNDWDWSAADAESRRAIELAPDDAYVYWRRGVCLRYAGRSEEAIAAHRHAEFLDPFSVVAIQEVGWALYYGRRFDEAIDQFHKAVELEPGWDQLYFGLGQTLVQQQRHEEAIAALRTAARMGPGNAFTEAALAYALGRAGRRSEAEHALAAAHGKVRVCSLLVLLDREHRAERPAAGAGGVGERVSQPRTVPGEPQGGSGVRSAAPGRPVLGYGAPGRVGAVSAAPTGW